MNQEVLIICESMYHGNTKKLADAMALKLNCRQVDCTQAKMENLERYKVIGLGSGIYFTAHHPELISLADQLKDHQKVFLFSTHGAPVLSRYHEAMKKSLHKKGIEVIGEFSTKGYDCTGPYKIVRGGNKGKPNERDEEKAGKFIGKLLPQYCKRTNVTTNGNSVEVIVSDCIGCGRCGKVCPMHVFGLESGKSRVLRGEECILCSLCQKNCPENAICIHYTWKDAIGIARKHAKKTSL